MLTASSFEESLRHAPKPFRSVAVMTVIGCLLLFALFAYLLYALIKPEQF
jgi:K+-transporting ATPase KdpF subunit